MERELQRISQEESDKELAKQKFLKERLSPDTPAMKFFESIQLDNGFSELKEYWGEGEVVTGVSKYKAARKWMFHYPLNTSLQVNLLSGGKEYEDLQENMVYMGLRHSFENRALRDFHLNGLDFDFISPEIRSGQKFQDWIEVGVLYKPEFPETSAYVRGESQRGGSTPGYSHILPRIPAQLECYVGWPTKNGEFKFTDDNREKDPSFSTEDPEIILKLQSFFASDYLSRKESHCLPADIKRFFKDR